MQTEKGLLLFLIVKPVKISFLMLCHDQWKLAFGNPLGKRFSISIGMPNLIKLSYLFQSLFHSLNPDKNLDLGFALWNETDIWQYLAIDLAVISVSANFDQ